MNFSQFLTNQGLLNFFFKAFAYIFSIIYLLFAIVVWRQTQVMTRTLTTGKANIINLISLLQIMVALVIIILTFSFV